MNVPRNTRKFFGCGMIPVWALIAAAIILVAAWKINAQEDVTATNPNQSSQLKAKGDLTPKVIVTRRGRTLRMDYQLIGPNGQNRLRSAGYSEPPHVAIYQGDRLVGSGSFRYG